MKKLVSCLLSFIVFATALTGCAGKTESGGDKNGTAPQKQETPQIVFMGDTFVSNNAGVSEEAIKEVQQYILQQTGILVNYVPKQAGQEETKLNMMIAAGEQLDVFVGNISKYRAIDAILPLNTLIDQYGQALKDVWPEEAWNGVMDGKKNIWAVPKGIDQTGYPVFIRKDWLDKLGLQMPKTVEEYENILKEFKQKDPAGSGNTIPMITDLSGLKYGLLGAYTEYGLSNWLDKSDGKIKPPELDPGFKDMLAVASRWYREGYIYKESYIAKAEQFMDLVGQNKVASSIIWHSRVTSPLTTLQEKTPGTAYAIAQLTGPKGKPETIVKIGNSGYLISKKSKVPEAAMKLINWSFGSYDNYLTGRYGIKDKHWKYLKNDKDMVVVDIVKNNGYDGQFAVGQGYSSSPRVPPLGSTDPTKKGIYDFIKEHFYGYDRVKKPLDYRVAYDETKIRDKVPTFADLDRMRQEGVIKFLMGARPIAEYDSFVKEMYKAGLQEYIDELTAQYKEATK